jgi:transcriptional regulator with XRE-family HTH domain
MAAAKQGERMMGMAQEASFADKLNELFDTKRDGKGRPHSRSAVARYITQVTGENHSTTFISHLRNGVQPNPRIDIVRALASFFGVPASYFLDDDDRVVQVAMRAVELDEADLEAVGQMIDRLRARTHGQ